MLNKMSIRAKMLGTILPIIAVSMAVLTFISAISSRAAILEQVNDTAQAQLKANINDINSTLNTVKNTAMNLSRTVGSSYGVTTVESFGRTIAQIIDDNDVITGSGIWFEPKIYHGEERMGPYWYRNDNRILMTMEYSSEEYDYFSQEYYKNAKALSVIGAVITDPYYDQTSGTIMSSCSAPIFNEVGDYIGCVTVDMQLSEIDAMVADIKLGDTGSAMLISSGGVYLYDQDSNKAQSALNIANDSNSSLASASSKVLANTSGTTEFKNGGSKYFLYYDTIPDVNWKLMIQVPESEMLYTVRALTLRMVVVLIISLIVCAIVVLLMINMIASSLGRVKKFAGSLADGDFTIDKLKSSSEDELGQMSNSLNNMYESNRGVISKISDESVKISDASENLNSMATELTGEFEKIKDNMNGVNEAMMSAGAATEQVSASVEEVDANVQTLAGEAEKSSEAAAEIRRRAAEIEADSRKAYESAIAMVNTRQSELREANEKAAVVNEIGSLASSIAEIASQIDLLSLNASIEAARAGEHGRGFAVVASEINTLANQTSETVGKIQTTIDGVQDAFSTLSQSSNELLSFLKDTVTPDYDKFVNVGRQYGEDAVQFREQADRISEMAQNIRSSMNEVSTAVQNIAESTQDTASNSADVTNALNTMTDVVDGVTDLSNKQGVVAQDLSGIVNQFRL